MKRSAVHDSKDQKLMQMDHFPHPNDNFERGKVEVRPGSVTEPLNEFPNLAALREFTKNQEILRKCKGFYSQPAAGRLGSDEIPFKFLRNSSGSVSRPASAFEKPSKSRRELSGDSGILRISRRAKQWFKKFKKSKSKKWRR